MRQARIVKDEGGWRWWYFQRPGKSIAYVYARTLADAEAKCPE